MDSPRSPMKENDDEKESFNSWGKDCEIILYFLIALVVIIFIFVIGSRWNLEITVESADLSQLDIEDSINPLYKLSLGVSIQNDDSTRVHFYRLAIASSINGSKFSMAYIPEFQQGAYATSKFYPVFRGRLSLSKNEGIHSVSLSFRGKIEVTYQRRERAETLYEFRRYALNADCGLRVPLVVSAVNFYRTLCTVLLDDETISSLTQPLSPVRKSPSQNLVAEI